MKQYTGWVVLGTLVFFLLSVLFPLLQPVPIALSWLVPLWMWRRLGSSAQVQTVVLLAIGTVAICFSASQGVFLGWSAVCGVNLPLLAMFVAVAFLTLTNAGIEDPNLPKGKGAVVTTAIGTHLLGSVINLSVIFVFGDRLQKKGVLTAAQEIILCRSFCAAAWWSPFFVATGVALTYSPGMQWKETLIPGAVMAVLAMTYSVIEVCWVRKADFSGYPLRRESLTVPVFLAALVIVIHHFYHDISVLILICILSPIAGMVFMKGRPRCSTLYDFIDKRVASVSSQFALFLAAGVFSTGIKSITQVYPAAFSLDGLLFTPGLFALISGIMIVFGFLGAHPVVTIAISSPLLLPLHPDPSQLGFLFVTSWAISTGSSPLSGVGLALLGRYHSSVLGIVKNNYLYATMMWIIASCMNILFFTD